MENKILVDDIKLDLMDWKEIEASAEREIESCKKQLVIAGVLRTKAKERIKFLDGKTSEEEKAEAKKVIDENLKKTTTNENTI